MTKISTITGMTKRSLYDPNSVSGNVPTQPILDYASLSSGELRLALVRRQLDILTTVHPDNPATNERKEAMLRIDNILHSGVHTVSSLTGSFWWGGEAGRIASEIKAAVKRAYPASFNTVAVERKGVNAAFELLSEKICNKYEIERRMVGAPPSIIEAAYQACLREQRNERDEIKSKNDIRRALNSDLEKSSHSPLYEFITPSDYTKIKNVDAVLGDKIAKHRNFADFVVLTSGLEKDNVRLWMRNGIMAQNGSNPNVGGALSPEDSILALASNPNLGYKNGQPAIGFGVLVAIGIALIIAASAIAIVAVIQAIQGKEPTALQYIGSLSSLAGVGMGTDFKGDAGKILLPGGSTGAGACPTGFTRNAAGLCVPDAPDTGGGVPSWALPVGAAAAAYLLLK